MITIITITIYTAIIDIITIMIVSIIIIKNPHGFWEAPDPRCLYLPHAFISIPVKFI